ncbi:MAG: HNH endonuclease [Myxococcota bacterium]
MARFPRKVIDEASFRQWGNCGYCGDSLRDVYDNAHHIVPVHQGGPDTVDNCVVLCEPCHHRVHQDGRFGSGVVASRDDFAYFNGSH